MSFNIGDRVQFNPYVFEGTLDLLARNYGTGIVISQCFIDHKNDPANLDLQDLPSMNNNLVLPSEYCINIKWTDENGDTSLVREFINYLVLTGMQPLIKKSIYVQLHNTLKQAQKV